ncbi:hypothetical protein MAR_034565 [Mya arenaria]|uniref:Endonuclease/exonuclease/phosphatase domain-containing protein n=1 Tax=Mya arenaria TaxID=6604 RepID=A0ABY7EKF1_MYAAR|nr:hypothetical protein MAR_034565 [Mya arenaria]
MKRDSCIITRHECCYCIDRQPKSAASITSDIETSIGLAFDTGITDILITGDLNLDRTKREEIGGANK